MTSTADMDAEMAETTALICAIIAELVGRQTVEPDQGFKDLGGESLRAIKAAGQIAVEFGTPDETNERLLEALLDGADANQLARLVHGSDSPAPTPAVGALAADGVLSYGEERLWLAQRYHQDTAAYHVVNCLVVAGDLDLVAFDRAVHVLADRHPALRTRYDSQKPCVINGRDDSPAPDEQVDIAHHQAALPWPEVVALAKAAAIAPFDLTQGRLLRVRSYPAATGDRLLLVVVHHIATDGWSMDLIYKELGELYAGGWPGQVPRAYREFARWQRATGEPVAAADAVAARLGALPDRLELGARLRRPPARSMAGDVLSTQVPAATAGRLRTLAASSGGSLYVMLLAAFYLCLARRSRQWDMLLGTVASGRTQPRFHDTVGFFASTLAIRVNADPDYTVAELMSLLSAEARWVLAQQDAPLEEVATRARQSPERARGPLVDAVLILQGDDRVLPALTGCAVTPFDLHTGTAKFDLMLEVIPDGAGDLELRWEYATDVLDRDEASSLAASFGRIVAALAAPGGTSLAGSGRTLRAVTGLSAAEWQLMSSVNDTARAWPATDVSGLFQRLARADPGSPAILDGTVVVSRAGLRRLRDETAACLAASGVRPGDVVAIHLPRSTQSVAALLAAWWIGAVPAFIDIHHPAEHRDVLMRACRPAAVLAQSAAGWPAGTPVVCVADTGRAPAPVPARKRAPDDAAWLVATSGSTGAPKLTVGTYRGLLNRCAWAWETFPYAESEVAALRTPLGFVDAIAEAAVPLLAGVPLAVVPDRAIWDARELAQVLQERRVTRLLATPSLLRHLLPALPRSAGHPPFLRWCASSGEPLDAELLRELRAALPGCRLVNLYGSSEVAGDATYADLTDQPADGQVPIGRPIANTGILVVGADGELVPPGTVGELVVTGSPVGLGYLVDGEVVAASGFRAVPGGGHGYWTGDLGWLGQDGLLYFAGRRDRQVKVRGCRVELGHVEAAVLGLAGVRAVAAWADRGPGGGEFICMTAVAEPGAMLTRNDLHTRLRDLLPSYMVPGRIAVIDALPLSANGKLDRAEAARLAAMQLLDEHEPPAMSPEELHLRQLWAGALGGVLASLDDDFFALGGDSLAANSMLAAVTRDTGALMDVSDFLAEPTIRALAARLSSRSTLSATATEQRW